MVVDSDIGTEIGSSGRWLMGETRSVLYHKGVRGPGWRVDRAAGGVYDERGHERTLERSAEFFFCRAAGGGAGGGVGADPARGIYVGDGFYAPGCAAQADVDAVVSDRRAGAVYRVHDVGGVDHAACDGAADGVGDGDDDRAGAVVEQDVRVHEGDQLPLIFPRTGIVFLPKPNGSMPAVPGARRTITGERIIRRLLLPIRLQSTAMRCGIIHRLVRSR